MYYELIDILRSPDLMRYLSGSYPQIIEAADGKRRQEEEREMVNKKNK
jgi:hypothetical protein